MDLTKLSKNELLVKCEELGITKCKSKNKTELIKLINGKSKKTQIEFIIEDCLQETNINNEITNKIIDDKQHIKYSFIEVCAGGGGLSSGLMKSGFIPVLLNDNNSDCCKTLKHNHPDANVICGSMDKIDYSSYIGKVDLLTGSIQILL